MKTWGARATGASSDATKPKSSQGSEAPLAATWMKNICKLTPLECSVIRCFGGREITLCWCSIQRFPEGENMKCPPLGALLMGHGMGPSPSHAAGEPMKCCPRYSAVSTVCLWWFPKDSSLKQHSHAAIGFPRSEVSYSSTLAADRTAAL